MTKREFDRLTKANWGGDCMASDERRTYRAERHKGDDLRPDYLAARTREYEARKKLFSDPLFGFAPLMGPSLRWRAPAAWARNVGKTLLTGRI